MRWGYLCGDPGIPALGDKGASIHVRQVVAALREAGDEVLLLARGRGGASGTTGGPSGALPGLWLSTEPSFAPRWRAVTPDQDGLSRDLAALSGMRRFGRAAAPVLRAHAPDLLYERLSLFGAAGLGLARRQGLPLLLEVNAPLVEEQARWRGLHLRPVAARVEDEVLRGADRVLVVSQTLADWARTRGVPAGRIVVLPNGVDPRPFAADPAAVAAQRRELGLAPGPVLGFVGGLRPWHGVAGLLEAAARLRDQGRAFQLLIVGDGPLRAELVALSQSLGLVELVRFTGAVPHEAVPPLLALMDVAVAPYAAGGDGGFYFSPLKVFEYMAAARPVVAADIGQLRAIVNPGHTGLLYRAGDAAALAETIGRLLDDPQQARRMGRQALETVWAEHTWASRAQTIRELGSDLLRERAGRVRRAA